MEKKNENGLNLESKEAKVTESSAEEKKSQSRGKETGNMEFVSKCESTEILVLTSKGEVTKAVSSASKHELIEAVESKPSSELPESLASQGKAVKLSVMHVTEEAEVKTDIQEQERVDVKAKEYQEPAVTSRGIVKKFPEAEIKEKVDSGSDSQKTECIGIELLEPPVTFQDITEEVPVAQKEAVEDNNDSQKKECKGAEEADEGGSSEETYCSELR